MGAYVIGVGKTRFGPTSRTLHELAQEAVISALRDASLEPADIQAVVVANFLGGPNESQLHLNSVMASIMPGLMLPSWRVEAACASGGAALHSAILALGAYDPILVVGVERLSGIPGLESTRNIGMAGDRFLDQSQGLNFPASYALVAQMHMAEYGTTTDDFDLVSLKNHANSYLNPLAHFHTKIVTQSDIDAGPTVASPIRLFDCCPVSDGAAAAVVSGSRRDVRSVPVLASTIATDAISLAQRDTLTGFPASRAAAGRAFEQAGVGPDRIDLAEVHDCFTIAEIVAIEDLGLTPPGQATTAIRAGRTKLNGDLPVNPSGGLKAGGHAIGATGIGQVYEAALQLRGEAGARQVDGARVALTHNVGGAGGTCAVHILGGA